MRVYPCRRSSTRFNALPGTRPVWSWQSVALFVTMAAVFLALTVSSAPTELPSADIKNAKENAMPTSKTNALDSLSVKTSEKSSDSSPLMPKAPSPLSSLTSPLPESPTPSMSQVPSPLPASSEKPPSSSEKAESQSSSPLPPSTNANETPKKEAVNFNAVFTSTECYMPKNAEKHVSQVEISKIGGDEGTSFVLDYTISGKKHSLRMERGKFEVGPGLNETSRRVFFTSVVKDADDSISSASLEDKTKKMRGLIEHRQLSVAGARRLHDDEHTYVPFSCSFDEPKYQGLHAAAMALKTRARVIPAHTEIQLRVISETTGKADTARFRDTVFQLANHAQLFYDTEYQLRHRVNAGFRVTVHSVHQAQAKRPLVQKDVPCNALQRHGLKNVLDRFDTPKFRNHVKRSHDAINMYIVQDKRYDGRKAEGCATIGNGKNERAVHLALSDASPIVWFDYYTFLHELGHTLGMKHARGSSEIDNLMMGNTKVDPNNISTLHLTDEQIKQTSKEIVKNSLKSLAPLSGSEISDEKSGKSQNNEKEKRSNQAGKSTINKKSKLKKAKGSAKKH